LAAPLLFDDFLQPLVGPPKVLASPEFAISSSAGWQDEPVVSESASADQQSTFCMVSRNSHGCMDVFSCSIHDSTRMASPSVRLLRESIKLTGHLNIASVLLVYRLYFFESLHLKIKSLYLLLQHDFANFLHVQ
jgi:hypothetical protein